MRIFKNVYEKNIAVILDKFFWRVILENLYYILIFVIYCEKIHENKLCKILHKSVFLFTHVDFFVISTVALLTKLVFSVYLTVAYATRCIYLPLLHVLLHANVFVL